MPRKRNPDHAIQVRFSIAEYEKIEDERRKHPRIPSMGAAVRALVNKALQDQSGQGRKTSGGTPA